MDDESRMRKLVKDFLTRAGYQVLEAQDGEEAVDTFYSTKGINLLVLDVMMPKMDGWEVVKEIRKVSKVPIIMLTAKDQEQDEDEVRQIAEEIGLLVANKPDSQDICFVDDNYGEFIEETTGTKIPKGNFVDPEGNVLGEHKGIIYYTVGQRRGLGLSLKKPGYVIKVDKDTNEVVVGDKQDLFANVLYGNKVNCMSVPEFEDGMKLMAKIRYNSPEVPCRVYMTGEDEVRVVFDEPQRAITPGQAVVFYDGDIVAGGATIFRAANENM